jgi:hypothetical protein
MTGTVTRRVIGVGAALLIAAGCGSSGGHAGSAPAPSTTARSATTTTTTRPQRADGSHGVQLRATTGVNPAQLARAERLLTTTIADIPSWSTPEKAEAAGYRSIGDAVTGDEHFVNWSYVDDGHILDPKRPESLVYEYRDNRRALVAAMYMLPWGSTFADVPDVGGALTQWHVHADLCLTDDPQQKFVAGFAALGRPCPAGTSKAGNTPMLHVWIVPNPCGPFAALEGVGAGQIAPGQTRLCDTTNAAVR